jgi:hypothetical protein
MSFQRTVVSTLLGVTFAAPVASADSSATKPIKPTTVWRQVLITPHFKIVVSGRHEEGNIDDGHVDFAVTSKTTGRRIRLTGSTWHAHAADGTPTHFIGYRFTKGTILYELFESGHLTVLRGEKDVDIDEDGTWQSRKNSSSTTP